MKLWEKICQACESSGYEEMIYGDALWCSKSDKICSAETIIENDCDAENKRKARLEREVD
jgi:hypothetical protein